ncbi:MAG: hypothetical protein HY540_06860 [Deltaproteobacteria bacterium]|nr:hypothetical protein [Deltaproteobacteria bacterium]
MVMSMRRLVSSSKKLGSNRDEVARKHRKAAKNFSQSRDTHEDRSVVQRKNQAKNTKTTSRH